MAVGVLRELLTHGVSVPDDIALVGFDDIAMCEVVTPRLTSVRIDRDQLGQRAVEALMNLLDSGGTPSTQLLPVYLVPREMS